MELLASKTIDRMDLWTVQLGSKDTREAVPEAEEAYVKVVSDKLVAVHLGGGPGRPFQGGGGGGLVVYGSFVFYPSTDGGFAGEEFIFMATETTWKPDMYFGEHDVYHIFSVEDSHVSVFDAEGAEVTEVDAAAGSFSKISLNAGYVYRISSTGRILVVGISDECFTYLPSLTGGFVGKHFLGTVLGQTQEQGRESILVVAHEDADVSVYDTTRPGWLIALQGADVEKSLRSGEHWFDSTMRGGIPVRIESTGEISVLMGKGVGGGWSAETNTSFIENLGDDMSVAGVRAGETFGFYVPTSAIVFATQDSTVEIDDMPIAMRQDEYHKLLPGQHKVRGNAPIIVEVLGEGTASPVGSGTTWCSWGGYLVSPQGLEVTYPEPAPIGGLGELIPYIAVGVAVPIIVIIAAIVIRKKRKH